MKSIKLFLLIISLIFFLNIILFNSFATLYIVKDQEGNNICITNQESLISKYEKLGYIVTTVSGSSVSQESSEPAPKPEPKPAEPQPTPEAKPENKISDLNVKIIDSTNYISKTGNYIYVEGILKNTGKDTIKNLRVKIQALDKYGKLISLHDGIPYPSTLAPKKEATYQVMVDNNSKIASFKTTVYGN